MPAWTPSSTAHCKTWRDPGLANRQAGLPAIPGLVPVLLSTGSRTDETSDFDLSLRFVSACATTPRAQYQPPFEPVYNAPVQQQWDHYNTTIRQNPDGTLMLHQPTLTERITGMSDEEFGRKLQERTRIIDQWEATHPGQPFPGFQSPEF